jgi:hypothetical protein
MRMRVDVRPIGTSGMVVLSETQKRKLGKEGRIPIAVEVGGETFRTSLVHMDGTWCFVANAAMRARGLDPGRQHVIEITRDAEPRTVEPPPELAAALASDSEVRERWDALAPSHKREYAEWIEEARREETRLRRLERTVAELRARNS